MGAPLIINFIIQVVVRLSEMGTVEIEYALDNITI